MFETILTTANDQLVEFFMQNKIKYQDIYKYLNKIINLSEFKNYDYKGKNPQSWKLAVISGGASGMGAATAKRFASEGGSVIAIDVDEEGGKSIAEEIGESCEFFKVDVTKEEDWDSLEKHLGDKFHKITSVVNAAGISEPGTIEDETLEHWDRVHAINGTSVFLGCRFAVKAMKLNGGSIVNFSSSFL